MNCLCFPDGSKTGPVVEPVLNFVHDPGISIAAGYGGGLLPPDQRNPAIYLLTRRGQLIRGNHSEFVEEHLNIGTVKNEILEILSGSCAASGGYFAGHERPRSWLFPHQPL